MSVRTEPRKPARSRVGGGEAPAPLAPLCLDDRELGVGFSATVRVTETGCEELTSLPRTLVVK